MPVDTMEPEAEQKKATWKDFSFEEHVRGFVGVPDGCVCLIKKLWDNFYRINVLDVEKEVRVKSAFLKIIETPEGYIIQDHTGGKFIEEEEC